MSPFKSSAGRALGKNGRFKSSDIGKGFGAGPSGGFLQQVVDTLST